MKAIAVCLPMLVALLPDVPDALGAESTPIVEAPDSAIVVQGNNAFAFDLYGKLSQQENDNLLFSPYSISTALAMTYAGARGETEAEMAKVLRFGLPQQRLHPAFAVLIANLNSEDRKGYTLSVANRLWGQRGYGFLPDFLKTTKDRYGAELAMLDFAGNTEQARRTINLWVEDQTQQKIKDLIAKGVLDQLTRLVLTNAIYFKGTWKSQFDEKQTRGLPFAVSPDKRLNVPTMHQKARFRHAALPDCQVLDLPYSGEDLSMLVVLPKKVDGLAELEKSLTVDKLKTWTSRLHWSKIHVFLPKFKMACQFQLKSVLAEMGMAQAFDSRRADFSGMTPKPDLFISAVIHKAFVDVNEEGTEAAAATAVVMKLRSRPKPPPVFRADHPFMFLIRDNRTGSILFLGRVMNPKSD